ncbi:4alpha-methylsterol monooxygenase [Malassezia vespertilionis]|uniref:4alpha-methylsterol monooxygenase n=1 Tax=Malassezia vespertilionis TaxID=2020962 RepID=UPI0024B16E81|nr:4alpha-methylsterol monooxygenase [Malassezia vespertilionis]WFD06661.1 4alpha-methylsterol monooxygenase [Malassezia vespertilionis]
MDFASHFNHTLGSFTDALTGYPTPVSVLYEGLDIDSLSIFEKLWVQWYQYWGNPVIATGVFSFVLHEIIYFGRSIPWMIIDQMPSMRNHFTVELPQIWSFHPICEYFGLTTHAVPFPSWLQILWQITFFFVFEDMFHYWAHRALHWGPLYKHIHKMHHEFSAPFGLAAEYAHPLEVLILGMGTIGGPLLLCAFTQNLHLVTVYIWIVLRLFQAVDAHSGYDFPISLHNWIPFWAGADHHDYHHMAFLGCYATSFRWWDHFMGTDSGYQRCRAREQAAKAKAAESGKPIGVIPSASATGAKLKTAA